MSIKARSSRLCFFRIYPMISPNSFFDHKNQLGKKCNSKGKVSIDTPLKLPQLCHNKKEILTIKY